MPAGVDLGVSEELLDSHWGWDRWAWDTLEQFAAPLGCTTVGSRVSRLVVDVNRDSTDPTLIRRDAEDAPIPGNLGLSEAAVADRLARFYAPYHAACDAALARALEAHARVVFFSFHTFTGSPLEGEDRDFEVGVLFDAVNAAWAEVVAETLRAEGLRVRMNEPYSGYEGKIHSVAHHGSAANIPYLEFETNQDRLEDEAERARIAAAFGRAAAGWHALVPTR